MKVLEVARKRNTIANLDTGAGKTLISVMLINEVAKSVKSSGKKRLIVFLAPTVALVHQVCSVIFFYVGNSFLSAFILFSMRYQVLTLRFFQIKLS